MEQAGVYRVTLYENKDLNFVYQAGNVVAIVNDGDIINIENSDCNTSDIGLVQEPQRNNNNRVKYRSTLNYILYDYSIEQLQLIEKIKKSIYGWIAKIEFYNQDTKVIPNPLRFNAANMTNISNSFAVTIENAIFGNAPLKYVEAELGEWILEQGYWDGVGIWTNEGIWKTV